MASELRKTILEADDIEKETVEVPQWGVTVEVRSMTGKQRSAFMKRVSAGGSGEVDFERFFAELIIATSFDPETGEQLFEAADRDALNQKSGAALQLLADPAMKLSGLDSGAVEAAKKDFS